jgi:hypothetical protein
MEERERCFTSWWVILLADVISCFPKLSKELRNRHFERFTHFAHEHLAEGINNQESQKFSGSMCTVYAVDL